jgi:hypothetical protein
MTEFEPIPGNEPLVEPTLEDLLISRKAISCQIPQSELIDYTQAGEKTGTTVTIIAQQGEMFKHNNSGTRWNLEPIWGEHLIHEQEGIEDVRVSEGNIAIAIQRSQDNNDLGAFWRKLKA